MATQFINYPSASVSVSGGATETKQDTQIAQVAAVINDDAEAIRTVSSHVQSSETGLTENDTLDIALNGASTAIVVIELNSGVGATTYFGMTATPKPVINTGGDILPRVWSYEAGAFAMGKTSLDYRFALDGVNGTVYRVTDMAGMNFLQIYVDSSAGPIVWRAYVTLISDNFPDVHGTGQALMTESLPVVLASDQTAIPASQSGTWNIADVSGTVSLPTGAATSANQTAELTLAGAVNETAPASDTASSGLNGRLQRVAQRITSLITLAGDVTESAPGTDTASSGLNGRLQRVAQRITSLIALLPASLGQKTSANSLAVTIASDQTALPTSRNASATDVAPGTATGAAESEAAPSDAIGFILSADAANTADIRWRAGGTASATAGHELQAGRDTGFIPLATTLSIFAISGTQAYQLTWVRR